MNRFHVDVSDLYYLHRPHRCVADESSSIINTWHQFMVILISSEGKKNTVRTVTWCDNIHLNLKDICVLPWLLMRQLCFTYTYMTVKSVIIYKVAFWKHVYVFCWVKMDSVFLFKHLKISLGSLWDKQRNEILTALIFLNITLLKWWRVMQLISCTTAFLH